MAQKLKYTVDIVKPETHYANVSIKVSDVSTNFLNFKMPVWAPGSYLVREFARKVDAFKVYDDKGKEMAYEKVDKNTWRVATDGVKTITATYPIYCYERSVRTTFIDADHAFLHNSSLLMLVDELKDIAGSIEFKYPNVWKQISSEMNPVGSGANVLKFDNFDHLADSPVEIGNHEILKFDVMGVPHEAALVGKNNADKEKLTKDLQKVCSSMANIVGEHPCKRYLFIIHNVGNGGGGLEHSNSTTVMMNRWDYTNKSAYYNFLRLCGHEYFHLWNVKRIRPLALGPFNYNEENYTKQLWVAEGITSYYDKMVLYRAGFYNEKQILGRYRGYLNGLQAQPGRLVQPLADASFDAWIKAYRYDENSYNTTISYYNKGLVVAWMLDMTILKHTKGNKRLDDLMQYLYKEYYKKKKRGFSVEEFETAASKIAGTDLTEFFKTNVHSAVEIDYSKYLLGVGINLTEKKPKAKSVWLGASTSGSDAVKVKQVLRNSPAEKAGLNVNDELLFIGDIRVKGDLKQELSLFKPGDKTTLLISRDNLKVELKITFEMNTNKTYKAESISDAEITENQKAAYKGWMRKN